MKQRFQGELLELCHGIRIHFAVSGFKMEEYVVTLNSKSSNLLKVKKDLSKSEKAWRWSAWRWNTSFPPPCSSKDIYLSKFDNWISALGVMPWNRGSFTFALSRIWVDAVTCDWKGSQIFKKWIELNRGKNEEGRCEAKVKRFQGGKKFLRSQNATLSVHQNQWREQKVRRSGLRQKWKGFKGAREWRWKRFSYESECNINKSSSSLVKVSFLNRTCTLGAHQQLVLAVICDLYGIRQNATFYFRHLWIIFQFKFRSLAKPYIQILWQQSHHKSRNSSSVFKAKFIRPILPNALYCIDMDGSGWNWLAPVLELTFHSLPFLLSCSHSHFHFKMGKNFQIFRLSHYHIWTMKEKDTMANSFR